ncbi:MAG TPA: DNA integrity scanning diadenylate cyclase DisA [Thermotogota bacterium]|nr:DNA integrity scanning diadenylate cyclase DisA [Thermotogota bacterium]HRW33873.1 DNA integrity scanning diadenylate cyclase DisA [Thermotogota bacterium]
MAKYELLKEIIKICSPGTQLRLGLENIIKSNSGGLILLMNEEDIERHKSIIQLGFNVNCEYTAQKIYELTKMDGAVILNEDVTKILYANVQLTPDPSIPTKETGMRHRNAERIAKQTGKVAIAVSRRRGVVSIYWGAFTYVLKDLNFLITMVDQGLKAIEKYSASYNREIENLNTLEIENKVTVFDLCRTLEKAIAALRTSEEIEPYIWEMGINGRLANLQLDEMIGDLDENLHLIVSDYLVAEGIPQDDEVDLCVHHLTTLKDKELLDYSKMANFLGIESQSLLTEEMISPRGIRMIRTVTKIPNNIIYNLVEKMNSLNAIKNANPDSLKEVAGIGEKRSVSIIEGLKKLGDNKKNYFRV